jgi:hypothetical protein
VPDDARNTSVRLTEEDREAIHEISKARRAKNDGRTRINDILVDALWELLQKETGKTPLEIAGAMPVPPSRAADKDKLKQMPPPKKKHWANAGLEFCGFRYKLLPTMPKSPDPRWRAEMQKQALELQKLMERHREILRKSQVLIEKTNELLKQRKKLIES